MSITSRAAQEREAARQRSGQFGEQQRSAPEMTLGGALDLSTHTPVDIDTKLAELYNDRAQIMAPMSWRQDDAERKRVALEQAEEAGERYEGQLAYLTREAEQAEERVAEIWAAADAKTIEARPYEQEFQNRGGWTRVYLTTGTDPHLHNGMQCSTCNREGKLTRFAWMTDYSGATEEQIIEDAGSRACTTCFPAAPTAVLSRPTKMFTPDENRKAEERAEREAAKAERDAKKIANGLTADGSEFVVRTEPGDGPLTWRNTESFKTERTAVTWATDHLAWYRIGRQQPERDEVRMQAVRSIAEAIATKHGQPFDYAFAELHVKADIKAKRITKKQGEVLLAKVAADLGYER
jgi:hypothetical protein